MNQESIDARAKAAQGLWKQKLTSTELIRSASILGECSLISSILEETRSVQATQRWWQISDNVKAITTYHQDRVVALIGSKELVREFPFLRELPITLATEYLEYLTYFLDSDEQNGLDFLERYLDPVLDRKPMLQEVK